MGRWPFTVRLFHPHLHAGLAWRTPKHLFDQNVDHDYFFKLPFQGAGCPIKWTVFYFPPSTVPSCPAYEPNSNDGEYSQPFRHIQYNRTAGLRPIATLAMLLCRRIAHLLRAQRQQRSDRRELTHGILRDIVRNSTVESRRDAVRAWLGRRFLFGGRRSVSSQNPNVTGRGRVLRRAFTD